MIAEERYGSWLLEEITYPIKWGGIELDDVSRPCEIARLPARRMTAGGAPAELMRCAGPWHPRS